VGHRPTTSPLSNSLPISSATRHLPHCFGELSLADGTSQFLSQKYLSHLTLVLVPSSPSSTGKSRQQVSLCLTEPSGDLSSLDECLRAPDLRQPDQHPVATTPRMSFCQNLINSNKEERRAHSSSAPLHSPSSPPPNPRWAKKKRLINEICQRVSEYLNHPIYRRNRTCTTNPINYL
jgi:hypothetical protein